MSKIKILHLVKTSVGAVWAFRLMRELVKFDYEIHVAMPLDGSLVRHYRDAGIYIHELNYSLKNLHSNIHDLRELVETVRPDIVHSHFVLTTLIMRLAMRRNKTPRIFEVPGPLHLESWFFRNAEIGLRQESDFWVPTCRWSYNRYKKSGIPESQLYLSYYGGEINETKYEAGKLRSELNLSESDIIVGMVAYMYAPKKFLGQKRGLKGHEDFIDAMKIVCEKYPNVYGVCIGGAWAGASNYEKKVREYGAKHCSRVYFLGTRKNVGELYQDIDVAVHPSHSENLGGAVESLSLNVPTIATNIGGFPDIVKHEKTGLLVSPKNPMELANAIERMILNKQFASKSAKAGSKLVIELMSLSKTASQMADIYSDILSKYGK